ncbi:putative protein OS=Streptomyces microflavus OX=1919 GN=Smic_63020 PE=4 SV=1 [Streptomyces microflavus]
MLTLVRQLVELEKRRRDYCSDPREPADRSRPLDRCGAQAYLRVVLISGGELLFCAHHGRKFEPELEKIAAEIQDETDRLNAVQATAADEEQH